MSRKYEVFARLRPGDDLIHVGNVDADSDRLARSYARTTFDEEDWDRMVLVAREDLIEVDTDAKAPTSRGGERA